MRDENRIDEMCEELKQLWHRLPDWRLGQLIENLARAINPYCKDAFYVEDEDMLRSINMWKG